MTALHTPDRNDFGWAKLGETPLGKYFVVNSNGFLKNVRSNRDFKFVGMRRTDENMLAPDFDIRRLFAKITRFTHWSTPSRSVHTERVENETRDSNNGKFNCAVTVPLLTVVRPTVVGFPTQFANDNWHPVDAA